MFAALNEDLDANCITLFNVMLENVCKYNYLGIIVDNILNVIL